MRRYSEAVKADVRRRMSPLQRQSVALISEELGIHLQSPPAALLLAVAGGSGLLRPAPPAAGGAQRHRCCAWVPSSRRIGYPGSGWIMRAAPP